MSDDAALDCALRQFLADEAGGAGRRSGVAKALLADIGYLTQAKARYEQPPELMNILIKASYSGNLPEISGVCAACEQSESCPVGRLILNP